MFKPGMFVRWNKSVSTNQDIDDKFPHVPHKLPYFDSDGWFSRLMKKLNSRPLTGIACIEDMLRDTYDEVFVTGFDFYARKGVIPNNIPPHLIHENFRWLQKKEKQDPRLKVDSVLRKVLDLDGYVLGEA